MLTNNLRTRYVLRLVAATAAACLLAGAPGAASAMPLRSSAIGSITVTLAGHPKPVTNSTRATFSWRTTGIVGETRCKLDGAAYTYCRGNPGIYGGLSDGAHTFTVRVRNGYQVTAKTSFTWLVDTAPPTLPLVSGGSAAWRNIASGAAAAGSATDALSGLAGYQWRVSTEGSPWSSPASGSAATVRAQGVSYVQFRSLDKAGNASAWAPAGHPVESMIRLDRTPPTAPTVIGGSLSWQDVASMTINGAASTDALSGVDHYEYRISTDGGTTYGAAISGTSVQLSTPGTYVVQLRAVDNIGLTGAWAPASPGAASTACIT